MSWTEFNKETFRKRKVQFLFHYRISQILSRSKCKLDRKMDPLPKSAKVPDVTYYKHVCWSCLPCHEGFEASEKDKIGKANSSFCALTSIKSPEEKCDWQWQFGNYISKVITSQSSELETSGLRGRKRGEKLTGLGPQNAYQKGPGGFFNHRASIYGSPQS